MDQGGLLGGVAALGARAAASAGPEAASGLLKRSGSRLVKLRAHLHWSVFCVLVVLLICYVTGLVNRTLYPIITFGSVLAAVVGLRINRPTNRWPWVAFSLAAVLWTITGVVESVVGASGDLSSARSLWPDVFAVPGYLLIGAGLLSLHRVRLTDREPTAMLDGVLLGAGVAVIVFESLLVPAFQLPGTWLPAVLTVVFYPTISVLLVVIAGRLAFAPGQRSPAFTLLLAGVTSLHIGDVFYALGEIGRYDAPQAVREGPYLLAPAFFAAAVLHPTARRVANRRLVSNASLGRGRAIAVAAAMAVPSVLLALHAQSTTDWFSVGVSVVLVALGATRIVSSMRQQMAAMDRMYHRATHDDLTGLPCRPLLFQHLDDLYLDQDVHRLTLMFIDLDRFKQINDTMGHAAGDEMLVMAATRVATAVRSTDAVYRLAGDEFVVLAPNVECADAHALATRIRESLRQPYELGVGQVFSSVSIGFANAVTTDRDALHALLGQADEAMYISKQNGRDATTQFDSWMRDRTERRLEIERRLHQALDYNRLSVHYQPIVSGVASRVTGYEALVRWIEGDQVTPPDEFIPVAEDSGLIVPLGRFVLDTACEQLARWRAMGDDRLTMSVNLSLRQVHSGDIVETVADALARHSLPGDALWLEITESVMAEDAVAAAAVFTALRHLGVKLSVDDFGTGYSSLSYLKQFPLSRVKIDRSFVAGIDEDESDLSLVAAVVAMANALGLEPVAEGVESDAQAQLLLSLGCTSMQGYLFGRPVAAAEVDARLAHAFDGVANGKRRCVKTRAS